MKLVILDVPLDGEMESPEQKLDDGESIVRRAVRVKDLYRVLKGMSYSLAVHGAAVTITRTFSISPINVSFPHGRKEYNEKKV